MSIVIPDEIVQATRLTVAELMQEFALALFQREKLNLGHASRLAGMSHGSFSNCWVVEASPSITALTILKLTCER
jgi:predicted HTH domain antitoxin